MGWRELFWKSVRQMCRVLQRMRSPVVVLKLESCVDQPFVLLGNWFWKCLLLNEPLHKILFFRKLNLNLILELPCALYSVYFPLRGRGWTC